jgi:hypothetical protein
LKCDFFLFYLFIFGKKNKNKYNLAIQTTTFSPNGPPNYQGLHSDPPNHQNLWKMPILAKYPHNTPTTYHFSIKKKKLIKKNLMVVVLITGLKVLV